MLEDLILSFGLVLTGLAIIVLSNRIVRLQRDLKEMNEHFGKITNTTDILMSSGFAGLNSRITNTQFDVGYFEDALEDLGIAVNALNDAHALPKIDLLIPQVDIDDDALFPDAERGRLVDPRDQLEGTDCCDEMCRNCGG